VLAVMVDNSANINKPKESLNFRPSLLKLSFGLLILDELSTNTVQIFFWFVDMEELLTITVYTFFSFVDNGRIVDHHS
jgi:hypothetical protein